MTFIKGFNRRNFDSVSEPLKFRKYLYFRQNVRSSKCPFDKMSVRQNVRQQNVRQQNVRSTKCPFVKKSVRQNVRSSKSPFAKKSVRQNVPVRQNVVLVTVLSIKGFPREFLII
jgi:hypothetical protein